MPVRVKIGVFAGEDFMAENMETNEIELIEELAENLQKWADEQSYTHSPTFIRFAPDLGQKKVILWLLSEKPMLGQKVQEDFKVLQEKVVNLNSLSARPINEEESYEFCAYVDEVKGIADDLVETLRQITTAAKKPAEIEQKAAPAKCWGIIKRIPGWIFKKTSHFILTVIGAVIVTIVVDIFADFGWLQSIKIIIYNIFTSK
jgi:hypothetical protein